MAAERDDSMAGGGVVGGDEYESVVDWERRWYDAWSAGC